MLLREYVGAHLARRRQRPAKRPQLIDREPPNRYIQMVEHYLPRRIGLVATLAPTVGPTVGGYITDLMSWHWLFFINIVPGVIITVGVLALVDFDQPNFALLDRFDW